MMYAPGMTEEAREARKSRSILKTEGKHTESALSQHSKSLTDPPGTGWDIGAAVRFLAGDEARWMTGEC